MSEIVPERTWPTVEQVRNEIQSGKDALQTRISRYDHAYEVYRATEPKGVRKQPWESKLRVKYGMQVVDTAMVNIVSGPPRPKVKPRRPQDAETAPHMEKILSYHAHEDHLAEKQPLFVQQGLIYGITAAKNHWLYKERERTIRHLITNPADPSTPLQIEDRQRIILRDGPTFEPWDVYDLWWEPNARDVDTAAYVVLRSWLSKDDLLRNARSESNPYGLFELKAVNELVKEGPGDAPTSSAQERMVGGSYDKRKDRWAVLEVWRDETYTCLGGNNVVLNHDENPYWHGLKPVVITQVRPDLFEMQGIGETELLDDLQQALHTIQNMVIDNMHLTVQRGLTYRESGVLDPSVLELKPRYKWGVTDHDDIQFQTPQPLPPEAYREREMMKGDMQLVTGINPYVTGSDMSGVDQNTATGVTTLASAASMLLRFKARMISYKGTQRTFEQWAEMVQQFMDHDQDIRIEGPNGYDWQTVSPQEVVGNYDLTVEGVEESLSKQQERAEVNGLLQALQPFAQSQIVNWNAVLKKVAQVWDIPPEELIQQASPSPRAAPAGQNGQNGQNGAPPDPMQAAGQQFPPGVQQAIMGGGQQ